MSHKAPNAGAAVVGALQEAVRHQQAGNLAKAEAMYRHILEAHPDHPDALHLLGMVTHMKGDSGAAAALIRRVITHYPDFPEAHNSLGNILKSQGDLAGAAVCYRKALDLRPQHVSAHYNLGNCYRDIGEPEKAAGCYRRAIEIDPNYAKAHNALGNVLQDQGHAQDAIECYRRALALNPRYAEAFHGLGEAWQVLGRFDEAIAEFEHALDIRPHYAAPYQSMAAQRKVRPDDGLIPRIQKVLEAAELSLEDRTGLNFALGKCFDDTGEFDKAFHHYQAANELKKTVQSFDLAEFTRQVRRLTETLTTQFIEDRARFGTASEMPVFVVGMPRSGTTLVEQILASHPQVVGAGELHLVNRMAERLPGLLNVTAPYPDCLAQLDAATAKGLTDQYLAHVATLAGGASRVVDKAPHNYAHLGLIGILFPQARVIHCKRQPMDVCLSCYFQDFRAQPFASDLETIGHCYRGYETLMAHWADTQPVPILHVQYEDLVADPDPSARRIVEFCGLDWDAACSAFHETERPVRTASLWQVRQPVYSTSVARWRRYEQHLEPLKRALATTD